MRLPAAGHAECQDVLGTLREASFAECGQLATDLRREAFLIQGCQRLLRRQSRSLAEPFNLPDLSLRELQLDQLFETLHEAEAFTARALGDLLMVFDEGRQL